MKKISFNNSQELFDYLQDNKPENRSYFYDNTEFCQFTWKEAVDFLQYGWKEGVQDIDIRVQDIESKTPHVEPVVTYDVTGLWLDVGAYLSGIPECMGNMENEEMPTQTVKVVVNCTASGGVPQEYIFNRGAAITAIIDKLLEKYFVDLTFTMCSSYGDGVAMEFHVDTKNMYSRELIAYYTANAAFLRRIFFYIVEKLYNVTDGHGYGNPRESELRNEADIYFPSIHVGDRQEWATRESTRENVEKILNGIYEIKKPYED